MFYKVLKAICNVLFLLIFRRRVTGRENIPPEGGAIVAMNHRSNWDVPIAALATKRKLRFMAKAEMFKSKPGAWFFSALGAFPVHRGKGDIGAIKAALVRLKEGHIIAMFPEGRRVRKGMHEDPKPGVVMLAMKAKVPVVPVHITGEYRWFGKINVTFGKPIYYDDFYDKKVVMEQLQDLSNELMNTINSL